VSLQAPQNLVILTELLDNRAQDDVGCRVHRDHCDGHGRTKGKYNGLHPALQLARREGQRVEGSECDKRNELLGRPRCPRPEVHEVLQATLHASHEM
jgi:hypothetical protein